MAPREGVAPREGMAAVEVCGGESVGCDLLTSWSL